MVVSMWDEIHGSLFMKWSVYYYPLEFINVELMDTPKISSLPVQIGDTDWIYRSNSYTWRFRDCAV